MKRMLRVAVASVWLYEGLWRKLLLHDAHELAVVAAVPRPAPLAPGALLAVIGFAETLLALAVLTDWRRRQLAVLQIVLLFLMNGLGIAFARGKTIQHPLQLVIRNVTFLACLVAIGVER